MKMHAQYVQPRSKEKKLVPPPPPLHLPSDYDWRVGGSSSFFFYHQAWMEAANTVHKNFTKYTLWCCTYTLKDKKIRE